MLHIKNVHITFTSKLKEIYYWDSVVIVILFLFLLIIITIILTSFE
jgi:hypothetical protein